MEIWLFGISLFLLLILLLGIGIPVSISTSMISIIGGIVFLGPKGIEIYAKTAFAGPSSFVLLAIPFFIFMANILEFSGIADDLYDAFYKWMGNIRGGLAIGTVIICAIFAAMAGISSVATVTMGLVALPSMLKRGYDKHLVVGCIAGGGALGILIPPSLVFILYGAQTDVSIGKLFMGGVLPGILLSFLFVLYVGIRCYFRPNMGPPIEEKFTLTEKIKASKSIILPFLVVLAVLGSLYTGWATPTEASAAGALGALICTAIKKKLTREGLERAILRTVALSGMIMWIVIGAEAFTHIMAYSRFSSKLVEAVTQLALSPWIIMVGIQFLYFFLGMILDPAGIILLTIPLIFPIIVGLGFDPLWFGVVFCVNMEMAYLTPPFGFNLFILKSIVPKNITIGDIYQAIVPFVGLQALCLIIVILFPWLATWLPSIMIGR